MRYTYINACRIVGVNIPPDLEELEISTSASKNCVITRRPDSYLVNADQSMAIANHMLDRMFGGANGHDTIEDAIAARMATIQLERSKIVGADLVLIFSATGEAPVAIEHVTYENKDFVITMDAVEKTPMRVRHRQQVEAIKLAIAVEVDATRLRFFRTARPAVAHTVDFPPHSTNIETERVDEDAPDFGTGRTGVVDLCAEAEIPGAAATLDRRVGAKRRDRQSSHACRGHRIGGLIGCSQGATLPRSKVPYAAQSRMILPL